MMRVSKRTVMAAACGLALALIAGAGPARAQGQTPLPIKIAAFKGSLISFTAEVALKKGFFKAHGLDPTFVYFSSCPDIFNAMLSGGVEAAPCPLSLVMADNAKGFHLKIVNNNIAAQEYTLIARKGLSRPHAHDPYPQNILDLKGKVVGVTVRGSDVENLVRFFLKRAGLDPDSDVTWLSVGGPPTAIAAFKGGRVDYLPAWEPEQTVLVDIDKAADVILDTRNGEGSPLFQNYISNMTEAQQSDLAKSPEKFARLAAAWADAIAYMKNPAHFDELVEIFASNSGLGKPTIEALLHNNLRYFSSTINCRALQNVAKFEIDVGDITRDQVPTCKGLVWSGSYKYLTQ